ncbi:MAG: MOSC domain-containing protein [Candidatus Liptonbacteria bacterium]|nr:MOSC domain-containing protein [Candidatus Liptonbacteria bacterium]
MIELVGIATRMRPKAPMQKHHHVTVQTDFGIVGDARAKVNSKRQITVLSAESWSEACAAIGKPTLDWTTRRANLFITGKKFGPEDKGKGLRIGAVTLLIVGECDPCNRMEEQVPGLEAALTPHWRGGVICKVLRGDDLTIGDTGCILELS